MRINKTALNANYFYLINI